MAIIDRRAEAFRRLPEDFAGTTVQGIGFDRDRLKEAGIEGAGALAAVTNGDNSNVLVARVARETFGVDRVVARIYDPRRAVIYQRLGFATVATVAWTTDQVMRRLLPDPTEAEWTDPTAKVCIVERQVTKPWIGRRLDDLEEATNTRVVALGRLGAALDPEVEHRRPGGRPHVRRRGRRPPSTTSTQPSTPCRRGRSLMRVIVAGGGSVGRFIAEELHELGHDVTIVDNDRDVVARAQVRGGEPPGVSGTRAMPVRSRRSPTLGLAEADVVAAVTGDDEDNLVISLLAKQEFGVPRVVARVNNPKNEWMFNEVWGVDVSVSTPHLLTALVEEAVTVGSFIRLLSFEGGRARLAEVRLAEGTPVDGKTIENLGVPRDATVVAVLRKDRLIVPRGDTMLRAGDEVIVLVTSDSEDEVKRLLTGVAPS